MSYRTQPHQYRPTDRARVTLRDSVYKPIDPDTGLGLRCDLVDGARLVHADICTFFRTRHEAEAFIAQHYPQLNLDIIRFDQ